MNRRLAAVGLAVAIDLAAGELPNRWHPVAWLGRGIGLAERRLPHATDEQKWRSGLALTITFVGGAAVAGLVSRRGLRRLPAAVALVAEALLLKQAFAIRALFEHAATVECPLRDGNLAGARAAVGYMVSRSTDELPEDLVASATIESLAENSSDSIVAPLSWYAVLGLPGAFVYRAVNTLDATVGYQSKGRFGTPSARLDDALNFVQARLTAALIAAVAARPVATWRGTRHDADTTPSPNAGWPMAAAAHALGVQLEKREHHVLNRDARPPAADDIRRARALIAHGLALGAGIAVGGAALAGRWRR